MSVHKRIQSQIPRCVDQDGCAKRGGACLRSNEKPLPVHVRGKKFVGATAAPILCLPTVRREDAAQDCSASPFCRPGGSQEVCATRIGATMPGKPDQHRKFACRVFSCKYCPRGIPGDCEFAASATVAMVHTQTRTKNVRAALPPRDPWGLEL